VRQWKSGSLFETGTYRVAAHIVWHPSTLEGSTRTKTTELLSHLPKPSIATIEVHKNRRTHLKIIPSMDTNTMHATLVDALGDRDQFLKIVFERRPAKIEVVGEMDLIKR
jgi:hypothetical protein